MWNNGFQSFCFYLVASENSLPTFPLIKFSMAFSLIMQRKLLHEENYLLYINYLLYNFGFIAFKPSRQNIVSVWKNNRKAGERLVIDKKWIMLIELIH